MFFTFMRFRIELAAVEFCVTFLARVSLHVTSKSTLLLVSRYFVCEFILMLLTHADCAHHLEESRAAFLTDSVMHAFRDHGAIAVETSTSLKTKAKGKTYTSPYIIYRSHMYCLTAGLIGNRQEL